MFKVLIAGRLFSLTTDEVLKLRERNTEKEVVFVAAETSSFSQEAAAI